MQYSTIHMSAIWLALALASVATFLLAFTAAAAAESPGTDPVSAAVESAATEVPPAEVPEAASQPAPSAEAPAQAPTESVPDAEEAAAEVPSPAPSASPPAAPPTDSIPTQPSAVRSPEPSQPSSTERVITASPSRQLPDLTPKIRRDAAEAVAPLTRTAEKALRTPDPVTTLDRVKSADPPDPLDGDLLRPGIESLAKALGVLPPLGIESLAAPVASQSTEEVPSPPAVLDPPNLQSALPAPPAGVPSQQPAALLDGISMGYLETEPAETKVERLGSTSAAGEPVTTDPPSPSSAGAAGATLAGAAERFEHPPPLDRDGPTRSPQLPPVTASGSGGSSFVPVAALLALLALAAPATLRRLGKVPDCRPPLPFVCALERPG